MNSKGGDIMLITMSSTREEHNAANNHALYPIMTTASTPVTPAPSTPTSTRTVPIMMEMKLDDSESPPRIVRPKSTPFPKPDLLEGEIQCPRRQTDPEWPVPSNPSDEPLLSSSPLLELPVEIHECILDHLFGFRSAASRSSTPGRSNLLKGWSSKLRHSRRREVSDLALVCEEWRRLIQDRLYRHLKVKGTRESVQEAMLWFAEHPHLAEHVKHVEVWFPVFQQKGTVSEHVRRIPPPPPDRSVLLMYLHQPEPEVTNSMLYQTPSNNSTLEEVFRFIQWTFPTVCVLTMEGGERKKPPMIRHFLDSNTKELPVIETVRTLVIKGQWNLLRCNDDFQEIILALPNVTEWHSSYAKPKSKAYLSMSTILPNLPTNLTNINITLEGDFKREGISPIFARKVSQQTNFCVELAKAIPTLEHLVYTGRVCGSFFDTAAKLADPRTTRLKGVELIVKNVCRTPFLWNDGTGIMDIGFIYAFESLVLAGVRALKKLAALNFLRIRFIDLDSSIPPLNPYFDLSNNKCTGIWSDQIVNELAKSRPCADYIEKAPDLGEAGYANGSLNGEKWPKTKPLSIKVSSYRSLPGAITIE